MRCSRVNCSKFLRWAQSGGCCCFILHNKHTVSTHSSLFPWNLNQRCKKVLSPCKSMVLMLRNSSPKMNKLWIVACLCDPGTAEVKTSFNHQDNYCESLKKSRLIPGYVSFIYVRCYHGDFVWHWWLPKENMKVPHIPPIILHVWGRFVFDSASQKKIHVCAFSCRRARRPL